MFATVVLKLIKLLKKLQCVGVAEQIIEAVEPPYEPHRFTIREVHEVLTNAVRTPINDV